MKLYLDCISCDSVHNSYTEIAKKKKKSNALSCCGMCDGFDALYIACIIVNVSAGRSERLRSCWFTWLVLVANIIGSMFFQV